MNTVMLFRSVRITTVRASDCHQTERYPNHTNSKSRPRSFHAGSCLRNGIVYCLEYSRVRQYGHDIIILVETALAILSRVGLSVYLATAVTISYEAANLMIGLRCKTKDNSLGQSSLTCVIHSNNVNLHFFFSWLREYDKPEIRPANAPKIRWPPSENRPNRIDPNESNRTPSIWRTTRTHM